MNSLSKSNIAVYALGVSFLATVVFFHRGFAEAEPAKNRLADLDKKAAELAEQENLLLAQLALNPDLSKTQSAPVPTAKPALAAPQKEVKLSAKKPEKPAVKDSSNQMASLNSSRIKVLSLNQPMPPKHTEIKRAAPPPQKPSTEKSLSQRVEVHAALIAQIEKTQSELRERIDILEEVNHKWEREVIELEEMIQRHAPGLEKSLRKAERAAPDNSSNKELLTLKREQSELKASVAEHARLLDVLRRSNVELLQKVPVADKTPSETQTDEMQSHSVSGLLEEQNQVLGTISNRLDSLETSLREIDMRSSAPKTRRVSVYDASSDVRLSYVPHNEVASDMPIVSVLEDDTKLWSGPDEEDQVVETLPKDSTLAVETRQGDWYRVIAPSGGRAWVQERFVTFNQVSDESSLRIGGADPTLEYN